MNGVTVQFNDEEMTRLRESAERAQPSVEELARRAIIAHLDRLDQIRESATRVLKENAELYRRLG